MKYFLYSILMLTPLQIVSQVTCKPHIIQFKRQSQVDSFPIIFKGCDYIDSTINIQNGGISNIDSLYFIKRFKNLRIINTYIKNVDGLIGIDSVGGIEVYHNKYLKNLHGLKNLKKARSILIGNNDSLSTLHGLNIDSVFVSLSISDPYINQEIGLLKNLEGLQVGFLNRLWLDRNRSIVDLSGADITWLENLHIRYNNTIKKLAELNPRKSIEIASSAFVTDISALNELLQIPDHDVKQLRLHYLPNLHDCAIEYICQNIDKEGFLFVENNGSGCNSIAEIKAACLMSTSKSAVLQWKVSPNPFLDDFTLEWPEKIPGNIVIKVMSAQGKEVANINISNQENRANIVGKDWPAGMYFYTVQSQAGAKLFHGKLVKL